MKWKNIFLIAGIAFSICSKLLQLYFEFLWGDILVLFAALFFVLAILLYIPQFQFYLQNAQTKKAAKHFAVMCCLTVLSFQLFTMMTFGKGFLWGVSFILPVLIFGASGIYLWLKLMKQ